MKQNILYLLLGIFLLASCQQEEFPGEESRYGYLSLKSVVTEVENVNAPASRALPAVDTKDLYVEVWEGEKKVLSYAPGEEVPAQIKLPVGTYTAKAYNAAYSDNAADQPMFCGESEAFTVSEGEQTLQTVSVSLHNCGITFALSEGFKKYFSEEETSVEITCGESTVTFSADQFGTDNYVYFLCEEGTQPAYTLTSKNADEETVTLSGDLDVKNGTCYTLTFNFQPDGAVSAVSE